MTSTIDPWAVRAAIDAAQRAAQEQQQAVADPPTDFRSQLHDRIAEIFHIAWPAPEPALSAFGDGTAASLESQLQGLVQAMAGFSPPAAGQTALWGEDRNYLSQVLAANSQ